MQKELEYLGKVLIDPEKPFVVILGGAKVSDKIEIIQNLLKTADALLIGGAMAYTFLKANRIEIGQSLVELDKLDLARSLEKEAKQRGVKLLLPIDHVVVDTVSGAGILVFGGVNGSLTASIVRNTQSDGIHMTYGSHDVLVSGNTVNDTGDDMIAVVSYLGDRAVCRDITIVGNTARRQTWGRGISTVGGLVLSQVVTFYTTPVVGSYESKPVRSRGAFRVGVIAL